MRFGQSFARTAAVLALSVSAATGLAACGGGGDDGGSSTSAAGGVSGGQSLACKDGAISVGLVKSQSGFGAYFDTAGLRGTEIAIDRINQDGGIKGCRITTMTGDAKSDPAVAAQVARSMVDRGAQILFVPDDFDTGIAAARVGQKAGVLTLSAAASSTQFGRAVGDLFFSAGITTTQLGNAQARYALDQGWKTTFQVLDPGLAYFTEQDTTYRALYESEGGRVIGVEKVDSLGGQSDYSATISKIKSANPDVVQALMVFPQVGTFVKQLRSAGVETPVIGNITLDTRELPEQAGKQNVHDIAYAAQVYFNGAGRDPRTDPQIVEFTRAYESKFGNFPEQANAPEAYQMVLAIAEALKQDDVKDAKSAADAIRRQTNVRVPGGELLKWENGYAIWNPHIVGLTDAGEFTELADYDADEIRSGQ
jgi:branched-chain amino acid transport system substrate-binding protein